MHLAIPLLLILLVSGNLAATPPGPAPFCQTSQLWAHLPLTVNQKLNVDFSDYVTGYNLKHTVVGQASEFATVYPKINHLRQQKLDGLPILQYHLQHIDNKWGNEFLLVTSNGNRTLLYPGNFRGSVHTFPFLDNPIVFGHQDGMTCYDALNFREGPYLLLDCSREGPFGRVNTMAYIRREDHQVAKFVDTPNYAHYKTVHTRKILRFHDSITDYNYIFRIALADGLEGSDRDNTFVQILSAVDIEDLQPVGVIDKGRLNLNKLRIMDVQFYHHELYILDYYTGVYRLRLTPGQRIQSIGNYSCRGFVRLSVFSDDLEDKLTIAVANTHAVHQIDWSSKFYPIFLTKYSLIENTKVLQVQHNERYVVVHGQSLATVNNAYPALYNYTWVFARNSRIFSNAFTVFSHADPQVKIDLERVMDFLLIMNSTGVYSYQLLPPRLIIDPKSQKSGTQVKLMIQTVSTDTLDQNIITCVSQTIVSFVEPSNTSLWPTGSVKSETLYANYPGQTILDLNKYAVGPNISYRYIKPFGSQYEPEHWIQKQNKTRVFMNNHTIIGSVNFLHTDVFSQFGNNTILAYFQDSVNTTYVSICTNFWESDVVNCSVASEYRHKSAINCLATAVVYNTYLYIINLKGSPNQINIFEASSDRKYSFIYYSSGFEGTVSDIAVSGTYMYVTRKYIKQIDVYDLSNCQQDDCTPIYSLTALVLKSLGVDYFYPRKVSTYPQLPQILFISTYDSIIVLDVDNLQKITLLDELYTDVTQSDPNFILEVSKNYLIIVSHPNIIEEYRIVDLQKGIFSHMKNLYLYDRYIMEDSFDVELNDAGNLFYLTALDTTLRKPVVLVFKVGSPLVNSLYDVIVIEEGSIGEAIELEVSGSYVDYVTVVISGKFTITRQYQKPSLVLKDIDQNCRFLLQITNNQDSQNVSQIQVLIANYPDNFNKSSRFPQDSRKFLSQKIDSNYTWSDYDWFKGHVISYDFTCKDCPEKIQFKNHLYQTNNLDLTGEGFARSFGGGFLLAEDVFKLHVNGSVHSISNVPGHSLGRRGLCQKIDAQSDGLIVVSLCSNQYAEVELFLTSYATRKGFTMGPYISGASNLGNVQIVGQLLMIVDVDQYPSARRRSGGVFLYQLGLTRSQKFIELEYIDTNDLEAAHGWPTGRSVYIGNAHLTYNKGLYRLVISETKYGIFIVNFAWTPGEEEISLKSVDFVDLNSVLEEFNFHMPPDASFEATAHIKNIENPYLEIESVLVSTLNYHSFEFNVIYDQRGRLMSCVMAKVYYRYGYYYTYNYVKAYKGYVVIPYVIPPLQEYLTNYSRQLIALYDSDDYNDIKQAYSPRYIITATVLDSTSPTVFDFNQTFNPAGDQSNHIGLVIANPASGKVTEHRATKNLSILISDPNYRDQNLFVWPYSDFYRLMFEMKIIGDPDLSLKGWQIALIVIGSIVFSGLLFLAGLWGFKKWRLQKKKTFLLQEAEDEIEEEENEDVNGNPANRYRVNRSTQGQSNRGSVVEQTSDLNQPLLVHDAPETVNQQAEPADQPLTQTEGQQPPQPIAQGTAHQDAPEAQI